jgi:hypothetical protein
MLTELLHSAELERAAAAAHTFFSVHCNTTPAGCWPFIRDYVAALERAQKGTWRVSCCCEKIVGLTVFCRPALQSQVRCQAADSAVKEEREE